MFEFAFTWSTSTLPQSSTTASKESFIFMTQFVEITSPSVHGNIKRNVLSGNSCERFILHSRPKEILPFVSSGKESGSGKPLSMTSVYGYLLWLSFFLKIVQLLHNTIIRWRELFSVWNSPSYGQVLQ